MNYRDQVITWLQDAYAMERSICKVLKNHAKDAKGFPEMHQRVQSHLEETERQADRIEHCLKGMGSDTSALKSGMADIMGKLNGAMTGMYRDELLKNALADYATEHFEIACYKSLIAAAQQAGLPDVQLLCEEILHEEEAMAEWLGRSIDRVTNHCLQEVSARRKAS